LGEHEGVGFMLADNAMDIHQSRLVIWHTAWVLDQGQRGTHESSMAKVICSEAIWRVVDRSMQILGGLGITDDTILARLFRDIRPFRIYDGPSGGPSLVDRPPRAARRSGSRKPAGVTKPTVRGDRSYKRTSGDGRTRERALL
jgi:hypothetical protein